MKSKCVVCYVKFTVQIPKPCHKKRRKDVTNNIGGGGGNYCGDLLNNQKYCNNDGETKEGENEEAENNTEFGVFCNYFKYPLQNNNNYYQEPIPSFFFCSNCRILVKGLRDLDHRVKLLQCEINKIISNVSSKLIQTTTISDAHCKTDVEDVTLNKDVMKEISRLRQFIFHKYRPTIVLSKYKPTLGSCDHLKSVKRKDHWDSGRSDGAPAVKKWAKVVNNSQLDLDVKTEQDDVILDEDDEKTDDDISYEGEPIDIDSDVQICSPNEDEEDGGNNSDKEYRPSLNGRPTKFRVGRRRRRTMKQKRIVRNKTQRNPTLKSIRNKTKCNPRMKNIRANNRRKSVFGQSKVNGQKKLDNPTSQQATPLDDDGEQQQQHDNLCSDEKRCRRRNKQKIIVDQIAQVLEIFSSEEEDQDGPDSDFSPELPSARHNDGGDKDGQLPQLKRGRRRSVAKRKRTVKSKDEAGSKLTKNEIDPVEGDEQQQDEQESQNMKCTRCNTVVDSPRSLYFHVREVHAAYFQEDLACPFCTEDKNQSEIQVKSEIQVNHEIQVKPEPTDPEKVCGDPTVDDKQVKTEPVLKSRLYNVQQLRKHVTSMHRNYRKIMLAGAIKVSDEGKFLYKKVCLFEERVDKLECMHCRTLIEGLNHQPMVDHLESIHINPSLYMCDQCGKPFRHNHDLNRHLVSHQTERPYICEVCGSNWKSAETLKQHITRTHNNEKKEKQREQGEEYKFSCSQCDKKFMSERHVTLHMASGIHRTQQGEPYECPQCAKKFGQLYSIKRHMRLYHSGQERVKNFKCPECEKPFFSKPEVNQHLIRCPKLRGPRTRKVFKQSDSPQPVPPPPPPQFPPVEADANNDQPPPSNSSCQSSPAGPPSPPPQLSPLQLHQPDRLSPNCQLSTSPRQRLPSPFLRPPVPPPAHLHPPPTQGPLPPFYHPQPFHHHPPPHHHHGFNNETVQNYVNTQNPIPTMPMPLPMPMPTQTPMETQLTQAQIDYDIGRWFLNL